MSCFWFTKSVPFHKLILNVSAAQVPKQQPAPTYHQAARCRHSCRRIKRRDIMAESKVVRPGDCSCSCFKEAVCIDAERIYDSCSE